jgi:putative spermidine/putrescine transport system ATP-binding protein
MFLKVENICKSFNGQQVLDDISFGVQTEEIASLIGPSGVGKTTLLSIIAGLEAPDSGRVIFATQPNKQNPVILVFQDYTLFPNMTVFENVAFGLRTRRESRTIMELKVGELLEYFQLEHRRNHFPAELSAGQKQRVAIARAMVVEPMLLLLDEPFANLDRNLKMDTARFIRDTQKTFGITTISVTHDLEEAFAMSDKIGIMIEGRLEQYDSVDQVYHRPKSMEVAGFLGPVNVIPPELMEALNIPADDVGPDQTVFARPEAIRIIPDPNGVGRVEDVVFVGHYIVYQVSVKDGRFTVYSLSNGFKAGDRVNLELRSYIVS